MEGGQVAAVPPCRHSNLSSLQGGCKTARIDLDKLALHGKKRNRDLEVLTCAFGMQVPAPSNGHALPPINDTCMSAVTPPASRTSIALTNMHAHTSQSHLYYSATTPHPQHAS